jgi:hypothetical protein
MKGRKTGRNNYKGCHQKELPRKCYFINRHEDVIQEDKEEDGLTFKDGTGSSILAENDGEDIAPSHNPE